MLISCWSVAGGAGTTVVTTALALVLARTGDGALVADLCGDVPSVLGRPFDDPGPGLAGWLDRAPDVPADALLRLEEPVADGLALLRRGRGALPGMQADLLAGLLAADRRAVVADCGRLDVDDPVSDAARRAVAAGASTSLLVLRPSVASLQRAQRMPLRPSGVVLVGGEGAAIGSDDVEGVLDVPVVSRVRVVEQVARVVDAGLLAERAPRSLLRDVRGAGRLCHVG